MQITHRYSRCIPVGSTSQVVLNKYQSGNTRIDLYKNGLPNGTATADLGFPIPEDHVLIKNYSENTGLLKDLQEAKLIGEVIDEIPSGFIKLQLCKLLPREDIVLIGPLDHCPGTTID
jgi:hypothetical protein